MSTPASFTETTSLSGTRVGPAPPGSNVPTVTYAGSMTSRQGIHVYSGSRTSHYAKAVQKGLILPLNAYVRRDYAYDASPASMTYTTHASNGWHHAYTATRDPYALYVSCGGPQKVETATAKALVSADWRGLSNSAMDNCNANVDVGPLMAQIGLVRDMIVKLLEKLYLFIGSIARMIKSGKASGTPLAVLQSAIEAFNLHGPRGVSQLYLEIIYGWRPFVQDCVNISRYLLKVVKGTVKLPKLIHGWGRSASSAVTFDLPWSYAYLTENSGQVAYIDFHASGTLSAGYNAHAIGVPRFEEQVLALNPLRTAWDVVPFSFVLDWIYDLSSWFGALEVGLYTDIVGLSRGSYFYRHLEVTLTSHVGGATVVPPNTWGIDQWTLDGRFTQVDEVRARSPSTDFKAKLPKLDLIPALSHWVELLALILSRGKSAVK